MPHRIRVSRAPHGLFRIAVNAERVTYKYVRNTKPTRALVLGGSPIFDDGKLRVFVAAWRDGVRIRFAVYVVAVRPSPAAPAMAVPLPRAA